MASAPETRLLAGAPLELLLVIDSEHLLTAAPLVSELLDAARALRCWPPAVSL